MTIKELEKRIADNQAKLEKREKLHQKRIAKLETLQLQMKEIEETKAKKDFTEEENWLAYDISDLEEQVENDVDKIADLKRKVDKYQAQLEETTKKANSRNIKVILDFLEHWKEVAYEYHYDSLDVYFDELEVYSAQGKHTWEQIDEFERRWNWLTSFMYGATIDDEKLKKALNREAELKYDDLVAKIFNVVGEIKNAEHLYVASNGQLNGYVEGENGKVKVETIGAGGYNIQRFHYRTLVKAM